MQKRNSFLLLTIVLLFWVLPANAADDSLQSIGSLADEVYRSSQDMVSHGSDGHLDEIILYGKQLIKKAEVLLAQVESSDDPKLRGMKKKIIASIRKTIKRTKKAIRLSLKNKENSAVAASEKASFQAKMTRRRLRALK